LTGAGPAGRPPDRGWRPDGSEREPRAAAAEFLGGATPPDDASPPGIGTAILSLNRKGVAAYNLLLGSKITIGSESDRERREPQPRHPTSTGAGRDDFPDPHPRASNLIFSI